MAAHPPGYLEYREAFAARHLRPLAPEQGASRARGRHGLHARGRRSLRRRVEPRGRQRPSERRARVIRRIRPDARGSKARAPLLLASGSPRRDGRELKIADRETVGRQGGPSRRRHDRRPRGCEAAAVYDITNWAILAPEGRCGSAATPPGPRPRSAVTTFCNASAPNASSSPTRRSPGVDRSRFDNRRVPHRHRHAGQRLQGPSFSSRNRRRAGQGDLFPQDEAVLVEP